MEMVMVEVVVEEEARSGGMAPAWCSPRQACGPRSHATTARPSAPTPTAPFAPLGQTRARTARRRVSRAEAPRLPERAEFEWSPLAVAAYTRTC